MSDALPFLGAEDRAFNALFADMVERLLAASGNPAEASAFIAEELRALVGARTVLVFQHRVSAGGTTHRLVSVYPERRKDIAERPATERLLELSHGNESCRIVASRDGSSEGMALAELGCPSAIVAPLAYGNQRVGALILLDLFDPGTTALFLEPIARLSSIFALVLRNGEFFAHLEDEVRERTNLLEVRKRELEASLREKEILLKEINHRVKNNLQIVMSLLYLKASSFEEGDARAALEDSESRIYAMALVHEELYRTGDFESVDFAEYARKLTDRILDSCALRVERIYLLTPLKLSLDKAIPCGLILSELIMNAVKHAFRGRDDGRLTLSASSVGGTAFIELADDGPGLPAEARAVRPKAVGLSIVDNLVDQIHARMEKENSGGAVFRLSFPC